jgi:hypothetical protein
MAAVLNDGLYSPHRWTEDELASFAEAVCPGRPLDQGIVRAVKVLHDAGIETFESCEGGSGHAMPEPTVRFHGGKAEGWRALSVCQIYDLPVLALRRYWDISKEGEPGGPYWEVVFREKP